MKSGKNLCVLTFLLLFMSINVMGCLIANPYFAKNDQVIWLGDSIFALSGGVANYLESEEMAGETYRHYYQVGADMTVDALIIIRTIREQYDDAFEENPDVRTIITDGGGNDVLISNLITCGSDWRYHDGATTEEAAAQLSPECIDLIDDVVYAFQDMVIDGFVNKGVENAIYMCVYYLGIGSLDAVTKYGWDQAHLLVQGINRNYGDENHRVVFVDPRPAFLGKSGLLKIDGIHPTDAGSEIMAELIWEAMQDNCIEQDESCVPIPIDYGL